MFTILSLVTLAFGQATQSLFQNCVLAAQKDYQSSVNSYRNVESVLTPMSGPYQDAAVKYQMAVVKCQGWSSPNSRATRTA